MNEESKSVLKLSVGGFLLATFFFTAGYVVRGKLDIPEDDQASGIPVYEVFPKHDFFPPKKTPKHKTKRVLPLVAIIIDDIGYDGAMAEKFIGLDAALTYSVLPRSPRGKELAGKIRNRNFEIMCHIPMEPLEYPMIDAGPGTLLTSMPPGRLIRTLEENLDDVPYIKGANNHMGSKFTAVQDRMHLILSVLKKRNLFFVDSFTNPESASGPPARVLGIPFAQRDVFIDHIQTPENIEKQLKRLVEKARIYGEAVGIGHPHPMTYEVLRARLPELKKEIRLVPMSEMLHTAG